MSFHLQKSLFLQSYIDIHLYNIYMHIIKLQDAGIPIL